MEDLERKIENLLKLADGVEFHRQQCVGGKHTDEINRWADSKKEQIRREIRNMIQGYTNKLRLENQRYEEVNKNNSKYVKVRSIMGATEGFMKAQIEQLKEENENLKDKIERLEFNIESWKERKQLIEEENRKLKEDLANLQEKYDLVLKLYSKYGTTNR